MTHQPVSMAFGLRRDKQNARSCQGTQSDEVRKTALAGAALDSEYDLLISPSTEPNDFEEGETSE